MVRARRLLKWPARLGRDARGRRRRVVSGPLPALAERGPYELRLFQALSLDDPCQIAVCADMALGEPDLAGYAAVVGDGTALIGVLTGASMTRTAVLLAGLCHALEHFNDGATVRARIDDPELVAVLTEALRLGAPGRRHSHRLGQVSLDGQTVERVEAHLRRLHLTVVSSPVHARPDVPADPLEAIAFRLAWYTWRLTLHRWIGLDPAGRWLAAAAVINDTTEEMHHKLCRFISRVGPGGAAR